MSADNSKELGSKNTGFQIVFPNKFDLQQIALDRTTWEGDTPRDIVKKQHLLNFDLGQSPFTIAEGKVKEANRHISQISVQLECFFSLETGEGADLSGFVYFYDINDTYEVAKNVLEIQSSLSEKGLTTNLTIDHDDGLHRVVIIDEEGYNISVTIGYKTEKEATKNDPDATEFGNNPLVVDLENEDLLNPTNSKSFIKCLEKFEHVFPLVIDTLYEVFDYTSPNTVLEIK